MSAHTPGPWIVEKQHASDGLAFHTITHGKSWEIVASTWGGPHPANAKLIAAAPILLQTLDDLVNELYAEHPEKIPYFCRSQVEAAVAAIDSARGQ